MRWGLFLLDEEFVDLGLEVGRQGRDAVSLLKADEFVVVHVDFVVLAQLFQFLLVGVAALHGIGLRQDDEVFAGVLVCALACELCHDEVLDAFHALRIGAIDLEESVVDPCVYRGVLWEPPPCLFLVLWRVSRRPLCVQRICAN